MAWLLLNLHTNFKLKFTNLFRGLFVVTLLSCRRADFVVGRAFFILRSWFITCSPHFRYSNPICSSFYVQWVQGIPALNEHLVNFDSDVLGQ